MQLGNSPDVRPSFGARSPQITVVVKRQNQVPFGSVSPDVLALIFRRQKSKSQMSHNAAKMTNTVSSALMNQVSHAMFC